MCLFLHFFLRFLYAAFNINNSYETYILKYISNVQKIILIKKKKVSILTPEDGKPQSFYPGYDDS